MAKIRAVTLVQQMVDRLSEPIRTGRLKPGDELSSISEMADQFGVSRIVTREALRSLEAKGIIEVKNGKRAKVRAVTNEPLTDYFHHVVRVEISTTADFMEIRQALEIQAAGLAALRYTNGDMTRIQDALRKMKESIFQIERFGEYDAELHLSIAQASHNVMMFHILSSIRAVIAEVSRMGRALRLTDEQVDWVRGLHEHIVDRILQRDAEGARTAMTDHFDDIAMSLGRTGNVQIGTTGERNAKPAKR